MKRLFLFCLVTYCVQFVYAQFSGKGSGTAEDPYLVTTPLHVDEIRYFQGKEGVVVKLMNDIDMSEFIEDTYLRMGWKPIPNFLGEMDGNGYTISGLFINQPYVDKVGFFSDISGANIHDLILDYDGDIIGNSTAAGLCPSVSKSEIKRCKIKCNNIYGSSAVGGLLGGASDCIVTECIVECNQIESDRYDCGGLIGFSSKSEISNNRVISHISNKNQALETGGIVGRVNQSNLWYNMFEGKISVTKGLVGGICGEITSEDGAPLVGSNVVLCDTIYNGSSSSCGRIAGHTYSYESNLTDHTATNANRAYNKMVIKRGDKFYPINDSNLNGMGVGVFMLKNENMYRNMGWDMDNVWTIDDGNSYPRLKWEVEKEMDKHKLIITNQGKEINDNDELTFLAEKVTTNLGGGISYTYYQCIPDEPIIENTSSRPQQVTVTITSEDFSHLKWAGINNQETDMKEATETRTCQLERSASVPLKLHAIFAEQDFGSYTANVQVSCDNFTRNFSIRFSNENPNKPICPTPFIDYADGKLTFSCDIEGTPEYHVNITDPDVNTFTVNGELQLERTYNVEAYATAEGYQPSETACLTLCWIDKDIVEYTDGLVKEEGFPLKIRIDKGAVSISGVLPNTFVSAYSLDGILLDSTTSASGTVNLKIPANTDAVILKFGDNSIKVRIK